MKPGLSEWSENGSASLSGINVSGYFRTESGVGAAVRRYVRALRQDTVSLPLPTLSVADRVSVRKAIWLLVRPLEKLKPDERTDLEELCQGSQELAAIHTLAQSFGQMVRERGGQRLGGWMKQVKESPFRHIKRFSAGLLRDSEEVMAGLTLPQSNGVVEGNVVNEGHAFGQRILGF